MKVEFNFSDRDVYLICSVLFEVGKEEAENILATKSFVSKRVIVQLPKVDVCNAVINSLLEYSIFTVGFGSQLDTIRDIEACAKETDYSNTLQFDDYNFITEYAVYFVLNNIKETLQSLLVYSNVHVPVDRETVKESIIYDRLKAKYYLKNKDLLNGYASCYHKTKSEFAQKIASAIGHCSYGFVSKVLNVLNLPIGDPQQVIDFIKNEIK